MVIELEEEKRRDLPSDAKHIGYREVTIQDIKLQRINTRYRLERYYSANENKTYEAKLPEGIKGLGGYGAELQATVIMLYFELRVPEEKIVGVLKSQGIEISAGQISNILTKKHLEKFEEERSEVLKAGLGSTEYQHIDETGARVNGQNQYTTTVCNEHYGVFYTNEKKDKETVEKLLSAEFKEEEEKAKASEEHKIIETARTTEEGKEPQQEPINVVEVREEKKLEVLKNERTEQQIPEQTKVADEDKKLSVRNNILTTPIEKRCTDSGVVVTNKESIERTTEEVIQNDITLREKIPILIADDAPQFHNQTEHRGLCWVHEDRHYKKLKPCFANNQKKLEDVRDRYWDLYGRGLEYKETPTEEFKQELNQAFDELFGTKTGYKDLDKRLELTKAKKEHMMLFLEFPEIPLDNNEAERALREFVVKRKVSNGTRSKDGTKAWDVFLSLVDTCHKQGVNFYQYIKDRIAGKEELPFLASLINSKAKSEVVHDTS